MNTINTNKWLKICLLNLAVVAIYGVTMRYKIAYSFPLLDQKNLQHAHSHFAFGGWVSLLLMVLMVQALSKSLSQKAIAIFNNLFTASLLFAYGMLVSFTIQGYGLFSIFFATSSVLTAFVFCWFFYKYSKHQKDFAGKKWFHAALLFNIISSLGTFYLSYMMATKNVDQHAYLAAVYWYLHFQYNGWFFFACAGLLIHFLHQKGIILPGEKNAYRALAISCIPAYGLSVLWANLPFWVYLIVVLASLLQFYGWSKLLIDTIKQQPFIKLGLTGLGKLLLSLVAMAYTIKILLQTGSVIPALSKMAFGFRPIVIAYLHLVLLASISLFLLTYTYIANKYSFGKIARTGLFVFTTGVFLNEFVLAVQGIASIGYIMLPYVNEALLGVSVLIFIGITMVLLPQKNGDRITSLPSE